MTRPIRNALVALVFLGLSLLPAAFGAEIPADLDQRCRAPSRDGGASILAQAGLSAGDASAKTADLDPVELAALERFDPEQRGSGGGNDDSSSGTKRLFGTLGGIQVLLLLLML